MANKYETLAKHLLKHIGGRKNVISVTHCITRLRFVLEDHSKADSEALKNLEGVVTVVQSGGQYQVVIGNHVPEVFNAINDVGNFARTSSEDTQNQKLSPGSALIDVITGVFSPILGVLAATGMIKGLLALFTFMGVLTPDSGVYSLLFAVSDGFFHYLPIFLGFTAAKKFKVNQFVGMALGASLLYLNDVLVLAKGEILYTMFEGTSFATNVYATFFKLPITIPMSGYASSVVPIILAVFIASKVEKFWKKVIPDVVKTFIVPMLTLSICAPLTFILVGPVAAILTSLIGVVTSAAYNLSPLVSGIFVGGFWQVLVIFGLHWGMIPLMMMNMGTYGYDFIMAPFFAASFAQTAVVVAIAIKTKDRSLRSLSIPTIISGFFGVTEPAIYGITLPRKKPFFISCIAAAVGGAISGAAGVKCIFLVVWVCSDFHHSLIQPTTISQEWFGQLSLSQFPWS